MTYDEQKAAQQHQIVKQSTLKTLSEFYGKTDMSLENLLKTCDIVTHYIEKGLTKGVIRNCKVIDNLYPRGKQELTDDQKMNYYEQHSNDWFEDK